MQFDRVSFTTATAGTGTVTVGTASTGFRTMAQASIPDGTSVTYAIEDGAAWETGTGVTGGAATTLTRVLSQSSTGALLVLSGTAKLFITPIAADYNAKATGTATVVAGRTYRSTNQSIPAGAGFTLVSFDTVGMAVGGTFFNAGVPTEGIIPEDGVYQVIFEGTGEGTATPVTWEIQVSVAGAVVGGSQFMAAANAVAQLDNIAARQFTAGQKVTVGVKHSNATALNLFAEGNHSPDLIIIKQGGAKGDAGGAIPAGATTQVQYNNAGSMAGATRASIDSTGHVVADEYIEQIVPSATPSAPAASRGRSWVRSIANQILQAFVQPDGAVMTLQPHIGRNRVSVWQATGNATTVGTLGIASPTVTGVATISNWAITNVYTQSRRVEALVTTAATTAVAGLFAPQALWFRGNAAGQGGFAFLKQWGPATGVATSTNRAFCGMTSSNAAPTDVQPSSLLNMVGMGWDSADANIQIMHNAGAGSATKVDLGASFPVPTVDRTSVYEVSLYCAPNSTTIGYTVEDMVSGAIATGTLSTNLPVNTIALAPRVWMSVGGTSSVIGVAFMQAYLKSEK